MAKTNKNEVSSEEEKLMDLYDQLASQWAQKVEQGKSKLF